MTHSKANPWDEYAKKLKEKEMRTSRDWHARNGLPVSVEKYGWEGRNYDSKAYCEWMQRSDGASSDMSMALRSRR